MTWRPGAIALARTVNALFFLALSGYCFLAFTPFAYDAFIKPGVFHALWAFIVIASALFWVTLLMTVLTLLPQLSTPRARGRVAAWSYVGTGVAVGIALAVRPLMDIVGNTPTAFALGVAAVVWPIWLAVIDHLARPAPRVHPADSSRMLLACFATAGIACAIYAVAAPLRIGQTVGIDLPPRLLAGAVGWSLILHLFVFMALFLAIMTIAGVSRLFGVSAAIEYWLIVGLLAACATVVLAVLVGASLGLLGIAAWASAATLASAVAAVWADLVRLRSDQSPGSIDSVALFAAPVAGVRSRAAAVGVLIALPLIANGFISAVRQLDWNFLLQKLSVLIVWLLTFASVYAALGPGRWRRASRASLAVAPVVAFASYHVLAWMNPRFTIDRYAAVDPSIRLIRDARTGQSSETGARYAYLRSQTLVLPLKVKPPAIDFVQPLAPSAGRRPNIFLIVIDSLRRDYLSAYNPRVAFTPEIGKLAADSFVFERAWTRYSGTLLSVPAIWAGGMVPHVVRQPRFGPRNTLLKLLDANDYRRLMDTDSVVDTFDLRHGRFVELNPGREIWAATDLCTTLRTLERELPRDRARPTFFYSLPQNVHPSVSQTRNVPAGETYPKGFDDRTASSVYHVDHCVGGLLDLLKRERLYDDSIIIVTSDHGDLLGEEGRWGHSFWLYPEVMRIPLIVHVPSWLKPLRTDLDAVVFSTDITPSLYVLLGYRPADLGPLFGHSFFTARDGDSWQRRREKSLLASSYGAVYGVVSQNGRRMYVVDTVDATEYALDLSGESRRLEATPLMIAGNRDVIATQVSALAATYHYQP